MQVLQEFYVTVTRKLPLPLTRRDARDAVTFYSSWVLHTTGTAEMLAALDIEDRYGLSFWESLVVAAALRSGAERIYSEDLQAGQSIRGIIIDNPFSDLAV